MLSILLSSHDRLYLATEIGLLVVVLAASWLVAKFDHPRAHH